MHAHSNRDIVPRYTSIYNSPTGDMLVICKVYYWPVITSIFRFTIIQIEQSSETCLFIDKSTCITLCCSTLYNYCVAQINCLVKSYPFLLSSSVLPRSYVYKTIFQFFKLTLALHHSASLLTVGRNSWHPSLLQILIIFDSRWKKCANKDLNRKKKTKKGERFVD